MNPARFQRAREVFEAAIERSGADRTIFIGAACGDDAELRNLVERLLHQHDQASVPLDLSPLDASFRAAMEPGLSGDLGLSIGQFRVIRLLGRGGMGEVYEVEQQHPRRRVALKLLREGLRTAESVRRFELEARVLGRLQHPGIACIHDAGVRHIGGVEQPYFVMELVRGRALDEHVTSTSPDTRLLLELFARVCDAVEHAHRMGVVHRDLKPSNILVDEQGHPKVLDFGVARLIDTGETVRSMHTIEGQLVGTLAYMSPEQISGGAHEVTSRSDVYSLGVVLFELLTGRLPLDVRGRSLPEVARMVREDDPSGLGTINPVFRGDLDTIVGKALEKDVSRRYGSAGEFGADLRRFLQDEPVVARPRTATYQFKKFARRHRELVAGLVLAFVVLIAGLVGVTWFAVRESNQRKLAEANAEQATWESYRNCIAAADRSLRLDDVPQAIRTLDSAPERLRGWEWRYLKRLSDQSSLAFRASAGPVRAAVIVGDEAWTGDDRGEVARWSLVDGRRISSSHIHTESVSMLAVSPDATRCVSSTASGALACWDTTDGEMLWRYDGHREMHAQPFTPNGSRIAVASERRVLFLDASTGREAGSIPLPVDLGEHPAIDSSGELLLCSLGPVVVCMEIATQQELWRTAGLGGSFSSDGSLAWVFSGLAQGIRVVEARSGRLVNELRSTTPLRNGISGDWTPSIVGASTIAFLDSSSGTTALKLPGHADDVLWAWIAPNRDRVVSTDVTGEVRVWDVDRCRPSFEILPSNDSMLSGTIIPLGRRAVTAGWGGVKLWDLGSGAELWTRYPLRREIHTVAASDDGSRIAVSGYDRVIAVLHGLDGRIIGTSREFVSVVKRLWWVGSEQLVALTADGLWHEVHAVTGDVERQSEAGATPLRAMAHREGLWATGDEQGTVRLGSLGSQHPLSLNATGVSVSGLEFNTDGNLLAIGLADGTVCLWDVPGSHERWCALPRGAGAAAEFAFSNEGDRLATGLADGRVALMDIATGDVLMDLPGGSSGVHCVRFLTDSDAIAAVVSGEGRCVVFEASPLAADLAKRDVQARAREHVDALTRQLHFSSAVAAAAATLPGEPAEVAHAAEELARARGDNANQLNSEAWTIARFPGRTSDEYALAAAKARCADASRPNDHAILNTLGVALMRTGLLDESITILRRCVSMSEPAGQPAHPGDLLALAIAEAKSGDSEAAREHLTAARASLSGGQFASDSEIDWLLSEATALVQGDQTPASPKP